MLLDENKEVAKVNEKFDQFNKGPPKAALDDDGLFKFNAYKHLP